MNLKQPNFDTVNKEQCYRRGVSEALDLVSDNLNHTIFVNAGLSLEDAEKALLVARRIVEDIERKF